MKLYYSPASAYSQKTIMAFYEKGATFEPQIVDLMDPASKADYRTLNPLGKVPLLVVAEKDRKVPESSIIIEYIELHCPGGTKLIPDDPELARQVRFWDRFFDLYVNNMMQKIFFDGMRPEDKRDQLGVAHAKETLDAAFARLDIALGEKTWAIGDTFSMADCAAAPALAYCRKVHPFDAHKRVIAYSNRLMERPSFQKVMKEAEPYIAAMAAKK